MKQITRIGIIAACMVAVGIFTTSETVFTKATVKSEPVEFESLSPGKDHYHFDLEFISSVGHDTNGDDLIDVADATFELTNNSSFCYQHVILMPCGDLLTYHADLGCPSTVPDCPDFYGGCGFDDYRDLFPQCTQLWGFCANEEDYLPGPGVAMTDGLPFYDEWFDPWETKQVNLQFVGYPNLTHAMFGTSVDYAFRDSDCDGILDQLDNCPHDYNPFQVDDDGDWVGQVCDCDDLDVMVSPKWTEHYTWGLCEDGKDNDCDGLIDGDDDGCILSRCDIEECSWVEGGLNVHFVLSTPVPVKWDTKLIVTVPSFQIIPLWSVYIDYLPYAEDYWYWLTMPHPTSAMAVLTYFYAEEVGVTAFDFSWVESHYGP